MLKASGASQRAPWPAAGITVSRAPGIRAASSRANRSGVRMSSLVGPQKGFGIPTLRVRQPALLLRGVDTYGNFDEEAGPDAEWSETALLSWTAVVTSRAKLIFEDRRIGPSETYGGKRPAT